MIKTNSKKFKDNFKKFIFEVIDSEDLPKEVKTERQKLDFIMDRFRNPVQKIRDLSLSFKIVGLLNCQIERLCI